MSATMTPQYKSATAALTPLTLITREGYSQDRVFTDWIALFDAAIERLPEHVANGQLTPDPPEMQQLFARTNDYYNRDNRVPNWAMPHFSDAMHNLIALSQGNWVDWLGYLYESWANPNTYAGQFFTPHDVCRLMVGTTLGNFESQLISRLRCTVEQSLTPEYGALAAGIQAAMLLTHALTDDPNDFGTHLAPHLANFQPLTVYDPSVGSGGLLLAAAERIAGTTLGQHALQFGLVQFYGQDIDLTCTQMSRINLRLRGLNNYGMAALATLAEPRQLALF